MTNEKREALNVHPQDVKLGDIIWQEDGLVVIEVKTLTVSSAITARMEKGGSVQWVVEAWQFVPVWRAYS